MLKREYEIASENAHLLPTDNKYMFFDIETTGFQKNTTILYLIGCGSFHGDVFRIIQWFNEDGVSEAQILEEFRKLISKEDYCLFTFNGESFDIPYIDYHAEQNNIDLCLGKYKSFDLYRYLKPFQQLFHMQHGRQKDWERHLGIYREDRFNGGELIQKYKEYLTSGAIELRELLLLHNKDDISGMSEILQLLSYGHMAEGRFSVSDIQYGDRIYGIGNSSLVFKAELESSLPDKIACCGTLGEIMASESCLIVCIPVFAGEMKHYYKKYQEYYYLPEEDRAIHCSVSKYVDARYRVKAKASTCYVRKEDVFLPCTISQKRYGFYVEDVPSREISRYRFEYSDRREYVTFSDFMKKDSKTVRNFLKNYIKEIMISSLEEPAERKQSD